ncbi:hypothetical protein, partial [Burkholderia pseudomallei]|uniref:hypothetical protein n=1 Tax=Burkholderia pseudomallei TaxID=28450 RepID=UPI00292EFEED
MSPGVSRRSDDRRAARLRYCAAGVARGRRACVSGPAAATTAAGRAAGATAAAGMAAGAAAPAGAA